jgi:hypothetical protein
LIVGGGREPSYPTDLVRATAAGIRDAFVGTEEDTLTRLTL